MIGTIFVAITLLFFGLVGLSTIDLDMEIVYVLAIVTAIIIFIELFIVRLRPNQS